MHLLVTFPSSGAMLLLQLSNQSQGRVVFQYRYLELLNSTESTASKEISKLL